MYLDVPQCVQCTHAHTHTHAEQDLELQYISASYVSWVVSTFEVEEIHKYVPRAKVIVVSNIHTLDPTFTPFSERQGVVFTGNFNHPPNRDAILYFMERIMPHVHTRVDRSFKLHIVGANKIPDNILAINGTVIDGVERVKVHGYVPDLKEFYSHMRVSVAPLRWGAGVKGKVNSAMKYGVPVVVTSIASEGMHLKDGHDALVSDDPIGFADRLVRLYNDEALWNDIVKGGFANVEEYFSVKVAARNMADTFHYIRQKNEKMQHRQRFGEYAIKSRKCGSPAFNARMLIATGSSGGKGAGKAKKKG